MTRHGTASSPAAAADPVAAAAAAVVLLRAAVDALAALDHEALTDQQLDELVVGVARQQHRLTGVACEPLASWEARQVWLSDRSRRASTRLARDTQCSVRRAAQRLGRASRLQRMTHTATAVRDGVLGPDHADLLIAANTPARAEIFATWEQRLVQQCAPLRYAEAAKVIAYWCVHADATLDAAIPPDPSSKLFASTSIDGTVRLDGWLEPKGGAAVLTELRRLQRAIQSADRLAGRNRSAAQRRAAALVEMAVRSASTAPGSSRPRPLINVLVGVEAWNQVCELANGTVLAPGQVVPLLRRAEIESLVFDGDLRPVAVSKRRTFVGALRRVIAARDRHCTHPSGCDVPADRCDVDHLVPWTEGGPTAWWNGRLLCSTHNRLPDRQHRADRRAIGPPPPEPMPTRDNSPGFQIIYYRTMRLLPAAEEPA